MKYRFFIIILFHLASLHADAMGLFSDRNRARDRGAVRTPPSSSNSQDSKFRTFSQQMIELRATGTVDCSRSFQTSAQLMICNCANEAGVEPFSGKIAVARVVFSRAKSEYFPNTVKEVICQRLAFSWMNGGFNSSCERLPGRRAPLLNSPHVTEPMLSSCVEAVGQAAKIELVEKPNEIYSLNYCNPRIRGVASWCQRFPSSSGLVGRVGSQYFGFERPALRGVPSPGISDSIVKLPGFKFLWSLIFPEKSFAGGFSVSTTFSSQKIFLDESLKKVLLKKYKGFHVYNRTSYSKKTKMFLANRSKTSPSAIVGDYNGDGYKDVVFLGEQKGEERIVVFISKGLNRYKDYSFSYKKAQKAPYESYFVNLSKSEIQFKSSKKRQAWQIEKYGGAFESYYFDGTKIKLNDSKGFTFKSVL